MELKHVDLAQRSERLAISVVLSILACVPTMWADTHYVRLESPCPTPPFMDWGTAATNIQQAVDAAMDNDLISVTDGTYRITAQISISKAITLQSVNGRTNTTIAGNGATRCVYLDNESAVVAGFTICNGSVHNHAEGGGGGVYCHLGGEIRDCIISNCYADPSGGGAYLYYGGTIRDSTIVSNRSYLTGSGSSGGGGACLHYGGVIAGSLITNNVSDYGGGVWFDSGGLLSDSVIVGNSASARGGGLCIGSGGVVSNCSIINNYSSILGGGISVLGDCRIVKCSIKGNTVPSSWRGGGISVSASAGAIEDSTICSNVATTGGGVCAENWANGFRMERCAIFGNMAVGNGDGGGVYALPTISSIDLRNCLVYANSAERYGGGVRGATLKNCTVARNRSYYQGGGAYGSDLQNCIIYSNNAPTYPNVDGGCVSSCMTPLLTGKGNISDAPLFVNAAANDYHLLTNSPCLDRGTNQVWMTGGTDLVGHPRILHNVVDMGCYEEFAPAWDTDNDKMPDWWEWTYAQSITSMVAEVDEDGDGLQNWQEYVAGTDPTNSNSVFRFTRGNGEAGTSVVLRWSSVSNRFYNLFRTTNLLAGTNALVSIPGANNMAATPTENSYTDVVQGVGTYFYKIEAYK